jgi:hypothetical protein
MDDKMSQLDQRIEQLEDQVAGILAGETPYCQKLDDLEAQIIGLDDFEAVWADFKQEQEFRALDDADEKRLLLARVAALEKMVKLQGNHIAAALTHHRKKKREDDDDDDQLQLLESQGGGGGGQERLVKKARRK